MDPILTQEELHAVQEVHIPEIERALYQSEHTLALFLLEELRCVIQDAEADLEAYLDETPSPRDF